MAELKKLGRYELRNVLGKGAMGVVYEGYDPVLSRRVAIKTILKSVAFDDETEKSYAERFAREAKAVARLNHPNIVQVHDFGVEDEIAYLVMEFIQGRELRSFFEAREKFETAETVRVMCELLEALDFAHEAGVIHRDIKPANVMLDGQRRVKLTDFGVARIQDSERSAAGTMVGTPAFMSPEQISGGKIDRRTDIFSAGTVLYQLLTGAQPFKGEGAWTVAKQIMQDNPPAPSSVVVSVSPAFDAVVIKALAKEPVQRYGKAREFAAALRDAHAGMAPPAPTPVMPKPKPRVESKASEAEVEFWRSIQNSADPAEFEVYLEQFPEGTYAQLARIKLAKLIAPIEAARKAVEEKARLEAEERQKQEALDQAKRETAEKVKRGAAEKARRDAEDRAKREAEERAKREAEEKARRAQVLAKMKEQQQATIAVGKAAPVPEPPSEPRRSFVVPALIGLAVVALSIGAYLFSSRTPAPSAPVAQAPAPVKAEPLAPVKPDAPAVDVEKIKREAEDRVRREYAEKSAAEQAAAARAATEKAIQEKQLAAKAAAEKAAAEKIAAAKAAQERAAAEKAAGERAATERAAAEKAAAEKAASEKAVAERAAAEKMAAEKLAAEKAVADRVASTKAVERATVPAAAPPLPSSREGMVPGRYEFRFIAGGGLHFLCDRVGFVEDIEVRGSSTESVSGKNFNNLQFRNTTGDSIAATFWGASTSVKLAGRATGNGYAGTFEMRGQGGAWGGGGTGNCTGRWTLVRK